MPTDGTSQAPDPTVNQDGANSTKKVEYTPEQQAHFEGVIKEVTARVAKEEREKIKVLEAKVAEYEAKATESGKKPDPALDPTKQSGVSPNEIESVKNSLLAEVEQHKKVAQAKDEELKKAIAETAALRKRNAMQQAIHAIGSPFHTTAIQFVESNVGPSIREDENGIFYVVGDDGKTPRLNKQFERMSLAENLSEYATKEKWLVKSDYISGAGSGQSEKSSGLTKTKPADLWGKDAVKGAAALELSIKRQNPEDWKRLVQEGKSQGLLGGS